MDTLVLDSAPDGEVSVKGENMVPEKRQFSLPATLTFIFSKDGEKTVAHALDFDLVAVADTDEEATRKIRLAVKTYVEYGLSNNWVDEIIFPAPDEFWEKLRSAKISLMKPIKVADQSMRTYFARPTNEANASRGVAVPA
jgi:hypothetical protein